MQNVLTSFVILPLGAYLLGSVPFGLLIGLSRGVDVRRQGSGNIGATNVWRALGRKWGMICFVLDVLKGLLPVLLAGEYLFKMSGSGHGRSLLPLEQLAWLSVGAGCILGHMFSIYLRFKGGKGVATSLGVLLGMWPYFSLAGLLSLLVWLVVWGLYRYVSLASIAAALFFPIGFLVLIRVFEDWRFDQLWPLFAFSVVIGLLVVLRHWSNILRLLAGTENRGA